MDARAPRRRTRVAVWAGLALVLAVVFAGGVQRSGSLNHDAEQSDQSAYLDYVRDLEVSPSAVAGDRNRMPVYPWLVSTTTADGRDDAALFEAGKRVNVVLSCAGLLGLGLWCRRRIGDLGAAAVVTAAAFSVFVFKAPFVQAEPLFYFLFLALVVVLLRTLRHPSARWGAAAGLLAGVAHLTKASVSPLVALFLVALAWSAWRARSGPGVGRHLAAGSAFVLLLGATTAPYLLDSSRAYGSATYNVNTSLYGWTDDWDESVQLRVVRGTFVPGRYERPSLRRYVEDTPARVAVQRELDGVRSVLRTALVGNLSGPVAAVAVLGFGALVAARRRLVRAWARANPEVVAFALAVPIAYLLLFAWWAPQAAGPRFGLTLFLPIVVASAVGSHRLGADLPVRVGPWATTASTVALGALLAAGVACAAASLVVTGHWYGGT